MAMQEQLITRACFDPAVKRYWLVLTLVIAAASLIGIPFLPFVALVVWLMSARILKAMSAELFERKLVVSRGVFFRVEKTIPLEKITDVGLIQGPLMRMFRLYRLDFETAGQSGAGALVSMLGVLDAKAFRAQILQQKERLQLVLRSPVEPAAAIHDEDQLSALLRSVQNIERLLEARKR